MTRVPGSNPNIAPPLSHYRRPAPIARRAADESTESSMRFVIRHVRRGGPNSTLTTRIVPSPRRRSAPPNPGTLFYSFVLQVGDRRSSEAVVPQRPSLPPVERDEVPQLSNNSYPPILIRGRISRSAPSPLGHSEAISSSSHSDHVPDILDAPGLIQAPVPSSSQSRSEQSSRLAEEDHVSSVE